MLKLCLRTCTSSFANVFCDIIILFAELALVVVLAVDEEFAHVEIGRTETQKRQKNLIAVLLGT